ncbi:MAG TPA: N-methyl-L-tryptophan oxidase [Ktedonobacterales bacterium]|nr:N-methyl-L-tryptophan oxidase [Ktedonobacterales bacterium]
MARTSALVVGGGVMGLATGCALAARGVDVTVLERHTVGHDWASSHGLSRAIRHEYGAEALYTRMVALSLPLWDELAIETGVRLYTETGVLTLGQPDDGHTLPGYDVMRAAGLPVERLSARECAARFPQFIPDDFGAITYNPTGGMLHASQCLVALAQRLRARGGQLREGAMVTRVDRDGDGGAVTLAGGETLLADRVVVTAGPWVHDVLPDLDLPVRATRQQVCYFSGLPSASFGVGQFPVFLVGMEYYGFPLVGPDWFKVGSHRFGATTDPNAPYAGSDDEVAEVRSFLRRVIPAAADGTLEMVDRCMYDVSPDEDFILDTLPLAPGIIVGSGFSGHGFKFGVLIGELLAALTLGDTPAVPLDRFRLDRFDASL